ncbi:DUF397 domain-containing protein [Actinacidiphila oryziradicis]|uniref:DUF397 domain-containing protein n=1 Tax=Actinacidiphila oryziradicis TaxID=2571141 RepID=A0A4V5N308_9ACTN|nr:DUF397 domain-containing protein [Actinacidiphila oryziradicis]TKA11959.1 DUF397 domain-containing protein [Actinacidiphila oryziradicis]
MNIEKPAHGSSELTWFKSSYSSGEGGACVEAAICPGVVHVRDSKDKQGPQLALSPTAWTAFVSHAASR